MSSCRNKSPCSSLLRTYIQRFSFDFNNSFEFYILKCTLLSTPWPLCSVFLLNLTIQNRTVLYFFGVPDDDVIKDRKIGSHDGIVELLMVNLGGAPSWRSLYLPHSTELKVRSFCKKSSIKVVISLRSCGFSLWNVRDHSVIISAV